MKIKFSFKHGELEYTVKVQDESGQWEFVEEEEEDDENTCDICHRTFKSPSSLKQHQTVMEHNG